MERFKDVEEANDFVTNTRDVCIEIEGFGECISAIAGRSMKDWQKDMMDELEAMEVK